MDIAWLGRVFPDLSNLAALTPGGQKAVFAAVHKTEGDVVLKLYRPGSHPERIEREIKAPLKVNSPRVPKITDSGSMKTPVGQIVWTREQKIKGMSLRELLAQRKTLTFAESLKIAQHIFEVLAAAEAAGLVHRDIKPENVIVDPSGDAWVIDFGLARHLDMTSVTPSDSPRGPATPGYAPQEQFDNNKKDVDARADIFAAGVTVYECLHGDNPFRTGLADPKDIYERVRTTQLPRLSVKNVPPAFVDFIEACTRRKAEHRIPKATEAHTWVMEFSPNAQEENKEGK